MNQNHVLAVVMANSMNSIRELDFSKFDLANRFLKSSKEPEMTKREFDKALSIVNSSKFFFEGEEVRIEKKRTTLNNKKMVEILAGRSVTLYHHAVLKKADKIVEIQFNCDGRGSIKLANGEIVKDNLSSIARMYANDHGIGKTGSTADISKVAWKVAPDKHPEIKGRSGVNLTAYLRSYLA